MINLKIPSCEISSDIFDTYLKQLSEREKMIADRVLLSDACIREKEREIDCLKAMIQDLEGKLSAKNMEIQRVENVVSELNNENRELKLQINLKETEIKNVRIQASFITSDGRFKDNGDRTVTDNKTGLMWKKYPEYTVRDDDSSRLKEFEWDRAMQRAEEVNRGSGFAGYNDWRLPDIEELKSIVDNNFKNPCINNEVFKITPPDFFWSSTSVSHDGSLTWTVYFSNGNTYLNYKYGSYYVRLVRSVSA